MKFFVVVLPVLVIVLLTSGCASPDQGYGQMTRTSGEVSDYYCINSSSGSYPVIVVANIGVENMKTADIRILEVLDANMTAVTGGTWSATDETALAGNEIPVQGKGKWTSAAPCEPGKTYTYRVVLGPTGRTQRISIVCE
jgi:hypothetical protein